MRLAVLGHVEFVEFARVEHVPRAGEIVHATSTLSVAAGGGAVAAVAMARWGAETSLFTALGDDALGHRSHDELAQRGVHVETTFRPEAQRRALTLVDAQRERTIVVIGDRLAPHGDDALRWDAFDGIDAVYITAGDAASVRKARRARVVVATSRILPLLREANIAIDALVGSEDDDEENYRPGDLPIAPGFVVRTNGAHGGSITDAKGTRSTYAPVAAKVTGDTYGAGDTFAAALTYALGEGRSVHDAASFAAKRAAEVLAFDGPYPR